MRAVSRPRRLPPAVLLLLPALLLLAACGAEAPSAESAAQAQPAAPAQPAVPAWRGSGEAIEVTVHELHCEGCEMEIEKAISGIEGVEEVEAQHETDLVRVRLADAALRERAISAIRDAIHRTGRQVVGEDEIPPSD